MKLTGCYARPSSRRSDRALDDLELRRVPGHLRRGVNDRADLATKLDVKAKDVAR
jgi:hypothetical protein